MITLSQYIELAIYVLVAIVCIYFAIKAAIEGGKPMDFDGLRSNLLTRIAELEKELAEKKTTKDR